MEIFGTFGTSGYAIDRLQLFQGVASASVSGFLEHCPVARLPAGRSVMLEQGACLYLVLRGALEVSQADSPEDAADGGAHRVLPGECVGELSVLDDAADGDRVHALEDSELLVVGADILWKLIDGSNGVARNLLRLLSFRVRAANAQSRRRQKVGEFYRQLSMADGLTGLHNRAWLNEQLPALVAQAKKAQAPLSILMIDIDHFKQFNDQHGHQSGDQALQAAATVISGALRPSDSAARYGGEEILVILPGTPHAGAVMVAERLCKRLRQATVLADYRKPLPHITASIGLATLTDGQNVDALIAQADAALYRAKQAGRDRIAL